MGPSSLRGREGCWLRACSAQLCTTAAGWSRAGRRGVLAGGSPARRLLAGGGAGACAAARTFRFLAFRSVGQRFSRAAAGPMPVDLFAAQRPGGASFRSRPRRGSSRTRPPGEGCVADPSLASTPPSTSRGDLLSRSATPSKRRVTADRSAGQQGLRKQGRSHVSSPRAALSDASRRRCAQRHSGKTGPVAPLHHRGLRFAPPLQLNASRKPWVRSSRPSPPPRRSPSRG